VTDDMTDDMAQASKAPPARVQSGRKSGGLCRFS
jgi:hypothetical protein